MLFYDLALGAWVRKPGSNSPPWVSPVLTIGSKFQVPIQFCEGGKLTVPAASSWLAGLKIANDFAGDYVASDGSPTSEGTDVLTFTLDLTTGDAAAYFTANPTSPTVAGAFQIGFTVDGIESKTVPLAITLQNSYLQD